MAQPAAAHENGFLTLDQILEADDVTVEKVACPEWGGHVYLRTMTADRRDQLEQDGYREHVRASMVALSLCDGSGNFREVTLREVQALANKSAAVMERLVSVVARLSSIGAEEQQKIEEELGNLRAVSAPESG